MIFDSFPTRRQARAFADDVEKTFELQARVFYKTGRAQASDPIPADLVAPVVHVERWRDEREYQAWLRGHLNRREREVRSLAKKYGGKFVGT